MDSMTANSHLLREDIFNQRPCGEVTLLVSHNPHDEQLDLFERIDKFVSSLGFRGLGDKWASIDRKEANEIIENILLYDLAYHAPMMSMETAHELARRFLALFSPETIFFTNLTKNEGNICSWNPISKSTFDTAIIAINDFAIGILCVEDED